MEKNLSFLKKQIMEQSRHHFIYGNNNEDRSGFIKSIVDDYPIIMNEDRPMAVYLGDTGLPKIYDSIENNRLRMNIISREYLHLNIADSIIGRTDNVDKDSLNNRLNRLYNFFNKDLIKRGYEPI